MEIADAQRDSRAFYAGGFYGQAVSATLWFVGAALATWSTPRASITTMLIGGCFIFPLTLLLIRLSGRPRGNNAKSALSSLGMQVAFVLPLSMPVLLGVGRYRIEWFFPALTILLGAHYVPFVFLYGMRMFALLAAFLVSGGVAIVMWGLGGFSTAAWYTAVVLLVFALAGREISGREIKQLRR
jgi:hypothetical protein